MNRLSLLLNRALRTQPADAGASPVRGLLERADRAAGHDRQEAQALRAAAHAWLRVVR